VRRSWTLFRAIVFDLDDTLYPERSYTLSGFDAVSRWIEATLGVASADCVRELTALYEEGHRRDTFDRWTESRRLQVDGLVKSMVLEFRGHDPDIRLEGQVVSLLLRLRRNYRLGLVSDGYLEVQRKKVAALGLKQYLDAVVLSDALGRNAWKPSVRPFRRVLDMLSVEGHEAVYVADNPAKDFEGARAVGMATIRFRGKDGVYGRLEATTPRGAPDREIDDLAFVEATLADISGNRAEASGR